MLDSTESTPWWTRLFAWLLPRKEEAAAVPGSVTDVEQLDAETIALFDAILGNLPAANTNQEISPEPSARRSRRIVSLVMGEAPTPPPSAAAEGTPDTSLMLRQAERAVREHFEAYVPDPTISPEHAVRVIAALHDPDTSMNELVRLVSQDAAIATRVLEVANSAYFSGSVRIETIRAALVRFGRETSAQIVITACGRALGEADARDAEGRFPQRWKAMRHHAATTAFTAAWFAFRHPRLHADRLAVGGMLADVGQLLALRSLAACMEAGTVSEELPEAVIDDVIDRVHSDFGVELGRRLLLPDYVSETCAWMHAPGIEHSPTSSELHALRMIAGLNEMRMGAPRWETARHEARTSAAVLGLRAAELRELVGELERAAATTCQIFGMLDPADYTEVTAA